MSEPLESESERTVPPSSMTLSAVYCATLPEPLTATRVEGFVKLYSGQYLAII